MNSRSRIFALACLLAVLSSTGCVLNPSCGAVTGGPGAPSLVFTHVPAIGSTDSLKGEEQHVSPIDYYVAVYIRVNNGWWTKPAWAEPETSLNCDGTWEADITTGGSDAQATAIVAFLLPVEVQPPALGGQSTLPQVLYVSAVAVASANR